MKPFLFLAIRPEDVAADDEYEAMLRCTDLNESTLRRVRLEQRPLGRVALEDWSGVILGGGPYQASDDVAAKSAVQRRIEDDLGAMLDTVVAADFPFLGACYGIGILGSHQGALVDRTYGEPIGGFHIELTAAGRKDPLFGIAPATFGAYGGHKEAIRALPAHAVNLASTARCAVQAFRVGRNAYATQFHPELDLDGLAIRVGAYKHAGYFEPHEADAVMLAARASGVRETPRFMRRFVELYAA